MLEHDGCSGCKHEGNLEYDEPCLSCRGTAIFGSKEYYSLSDRFENAEEPNNVNHPSHYQGTHECIDEMIYLFGIDAVIGFCKCNVHKYRYRANAKGGQEDLDKANWYMDKLIELKGVKKHDN